MKQLILYAAADRYNYGDNLMPIILGKYLQANFPETAKKVEIVYAAVKSSNLSSFGCEPTTAIADLLGAPKGSAVIVAGGEVLAARRDALLAHMFTGKLSAQGFRAARRASKPLASFIAEKLFPSPWEFPYLPRAEAFSNQIGVAYNAIGGGLGSDISPSDRSEIFRRFSSASYVSVRDRGTCQSLSGVEEVVVTPDSAILMFEYFSPHKPPALPAEYVVVQLAPRKAGFTAEKAAEQIDALSVDFGLPVVLLPIGYASGHDDLPFLAAVSGYLKASHVLVRHQTIIETMGIIANAKLFVGTSLHGIITAMSFAVPYVAVNPEVRKLKEYLACWGTGSARAASAFSDLIRSAKAALDGRAQLGPASVNLRMLAKANNAKLIESLLMDGYLQ